MATWFFVWRRERSLGGNLLWLAAFLLVCFLAADWPSPAIDSRTIEAVKNRVRFEIRQAWRKELGIRPSRADPRAHEELTRRLPTLERLEVKIEDARFYGKDTVVRTRIALDGHPPPDGRSIRFFHVEYYSYFLPIDDVFVTASNELSFRVRPW